jgi:diguanylate cyclase (GGDEF)-like protein
MPETDAKAVLATGERLRGNLEKMEVITAQGVRSVTVSMGAASFDGTDCSVINLDVLIKRADQALYEAKNAGRNCVRFWQVESP